MYFIFIKKHTKKLETMGDLVNDYVYLLFFYLIISRKGHGPITCSCLDRVWSNRCFVRGKEKWDKMVPMPFYSESHHQPKQHCCQSNNNYNNNNNDFCFVTQSFTKNPKKKSKSFMKKTPIFMKGICVVLLYQLNINCFSF